MKIHRPKMRLAVWSIILVAALFTLMFAIQQAKAFASWSVRNDADIPIPPTPGDYIPISIESLHSVTPLNITKTFDWATGYTDQEKIVYIVRRGNGSYEKYLFPINYGGDIKATIRLKNEDMIVVSAPLVPLKSTPMLDKPYSASPQQEIVIPYPAPLSVTSVSPNPYP